MSKNIPFNIKLLDPSKGRLGTILPVTTLDIYDSEKDYHPQGLYSSQIFGRPGEHARQTQFGYIDMHSRVLHPKVFLELVRLKALYKGLMSGSAYALWDDELKDFVKSDIIDGQTGYAFFMSHYKDIVFKRNESTARDLRIDLLEKTRPNSLYRYLLVIPAGLRDIEVGDDGRTVENDINPLYRKVLRVANTISPESSDKNDPVMDTARWTMQVNFNAIYAHIEDILEGKRGFLLDKWGSRQIHQGTRNVITAMDPAPAELGSPGAISVNDTLVGLHQYLKGTVDLSIYGIKTGPMSKILDALPGRIPVVDPETLKGKIIDASIFTRDKWGSGEGIEELINGYAKIENRHRPILLDGNYAALIYSDDKFFRVIYDIDEVPEGWDRTKVRPMTWTEMYYISVAPQVNRVAGLVTRYPVTGSGSIYMTNILLKTTTVGKRLRSLDTGWHPLADDETFSQMPILDAPFLESMSVHPSKVDGLGADYDGDMTSLNFIVSDEAVKEAKRYLHSPEAFLSPQGGLNYGINNPIASMVLHNLTGGLK